MLRRKPRQSGVSLIEALVVFAALNSVLSLAYYAPLINALYRLEPSPAVRAGQPLPPQRSVKPERRIRASAGDDQRCDQERHQHRE